MQSNSKLAEHEDRLDLQFRDPHWKSLDRCLIGLRLGFVSLVSNSSTYGCPIILLRERMFT